MEIEILWCHEYNNNIPCNVLRLASFVAEDLYLQQWIQMIIQVNEVCKAAKNTFGKYVGHKSTCFVSVIIYFNKYLLYQNLSLQAIIPFTFIFKVWHFWREQFATSIYIKTSKNITTTGWKKILFYPLWNGIRLWFTARYIISVRNCSLNLNHVTAQPTFYKTRLLKETWFYLNNRSN